MLWAPYATTGSNWIANKVLQGAIGAPIESLCEISIADVVRQAFIYSSDNYLSSILTYLLHPN